jgi:ribose 5-phosphate isomerase A
MSNNSDGKIAVAQAALSYIKPGMVVGVGTGKTVAVFIEQLAQSKNVIAGAIASSQDTQKKLATCGIEVIDFNMVDDVPIYIDSADEVNLLRQMIKGGGGALTREKILATAAQQFICMAEESKIVDQLGRFPLPVEVIPMARHWVASLLARKGGRPIYRDGFITDNGNVILDVYDFAIDDAVKMELELNNIPGIITNGIFALRAADILLVSNGGATNVYHASK